MTDRLDNFRAGYQNLEHRVHVAVRTQVGDRQRIQQQIEEVLTFWSSAQQVFCLSLQATPTS